MNSSVAKEMGKKDTEKESVDIERIYPRQRIRIILSDFFKVTSVVNGIESPRLEMNEEGQVSWPMLQLFSSHDGLSTSCPSPFESLARVSLPIDKRDNQ